MFKSSSSPVTDWVKIRGHLDSSLSIFTWKGSVFSNILDQPDVHLFDIIGVNLARFFPKDDMWLMMSKEISIYLDPNTDEKCNIWLNPFSNKSIRVVHIANDPVKGVFKNDLPCFINQDNIIYNFDIPVSYLITYLKDTPYDLKYDYKAFESFTFFSSIYDLEQPSVYNTSISWKRLCPFLPWMQIDTPGQLLYTAVGSKLKYISELHPILINELDRLPSFSSIPDTWSNEKNMNSISYFKKYISLYEQSNVEFPISDSLSSSLS